MSFEDNHEEYRGNEILTPHPGDCVIGILPSDRLPGIWYCARSKECIFTYYPHLLASFLPSFLLTVRNSGTVNSGDGVPERTTGEQEKTRLLLAPAFRDRSGRRCNNHNNRWPRRRRWPGWSGIGSNHPFEKSSSYCCCCCCCRCLGSTRSFLLTS